MLVAICKCAGHTCTVYNFISCKTDPERSFQISIPVYFWSVIAAHYIVSV